MPTSFNIITFSVHLSCFPELSQIHSLILDLCCCSGNISCSIQAPQVPKRLSTTSACLEWSSALLPELVLNPEAFAAGQIHEEGSASASHFLLQNEEDQISKPDLMSTWNHQGTCLPGSLLSGARMGCLQQVHGKRLLWLWLCHQVMSPGVRGDCHPPEEGFWCHLTADSEARTRL